MYKTLTINGTDYKLEYSIEASLYRDCIDKVSGMLFNVVAGQASKEMQPIISAMSDIPTTAITVFYAGLLEHHGVDGDNSVPNIGVAKRLAVSILRDNDNEVKNWYDLLVICMDQMGEDGFFDLVGLSEILNTEESPVPKKKTTRKRTVKEVSET